MVGSDNMYFVFDCFVRLGRVRSRRRRSDWLEIQKTESAPSMQNARSQGALFVWLETKKIVIRRSQLVNYIFNCTISSCGYLSLYLVLALLRRNNFCSRCLRFHSSFLSRFFLCTTGLPLSLAPWFFPFILSLDDDTTDSFAFVCN